MNDSHATQINYTHNYHFFPYILNMPYQKYFTHTRLINLYIYKIQFKNLYKTHVVRKKNMMRANYIQFSVFFFFLFFPRHYSALHIKSTCLISLPELCFIAYWYGFKVTVHRSSLGLCPALFFRNVSEL